MIRKVLLTAALATLGTAATAQDWSGARVGLQATSASFDTTYVLNGIAGDTYPGSGSMAGLYAGYDHQIGNLVLGGELAYSAGTSELDEFTGYLFDDMLDVKARVGYSLGRVLPYAVIGWSKTEWVNQLVSPVDADGAAFGVGAEVQVSDRLTVGLEYLQRNLVGDAFVEAPDQNIEADFSTLTLRLGFAF